MAGFTGNGGVAFVFLLQPFLFIVCFMARLAVVMHGVGMVLAFLHIRQPLCLFAFDIISLFVALDAILYLATFFQINERFIFLVIS